MAVVISLINMKGGVGKTTLTVALAEFMAIEHGLKVLVIDLDPQSNATACLMNLKEWKRKLVRGQTIMSLFLDPFKKRQVFSPAETVVRNASNIGGGVPGLDLIPSGLELMDVQDRLMMLSDSSESQHGPIYLLRDTMWDMLQYYDIVLIDCPPSLGIVTQNGLAVSDYYLVPVIPETLSIYGIPQVVARVNRFGHQTGLLIEPLGLVATRFREQNSDHAINLHEMRAGSRKKGYRRVFDTVIPECAQAAKAMDYRKTPRNLREKYGRDKPFKQYRDLTEEVLSCVGR